MSISHPLHPKIIVHETLIKVNRSPLSSSLNGRADISDNFFTDPTTVSKDFKMERQNKPAIEREEFNVG